MVKKILKFGGTSVGTIERIQHVANIIKKERSSGNKVIAVVVSNHNDYGSYRYIPCYPSKIYDYYEIPIIFIDELTDEVFSDYNSTKEFLEYIYDSTNQIIKCKPAYKIVENDLTIGILTNANQFVMINKPEIYIKDDLPELSDKNYLFTDIIIQNLSLIHI